MDQFNQPNPNSNKQPVETKTKKFSNYTKYKMVNGKKTYMDDVDFSLVMQGTHHRPSYTFPLRTFLDE